MYTLGRRSSKTSRLSWSERASSQKLAGADMLCAVVGVMERSRTMARGLDGSKIGDAGESGSERCRSGSSCSWASPVNGCLSKASKASSSSSSSSGTRLSTSPGASRAPFASSTISANRFVDISCPPDRMNVASAWVFSGLALASRGARGFELCRCRRMNVASSAVDQCSPRASRATYGVLGRWRQDV